MSDSLDVRRTVVALDCPDAPALARFYATLLGWEVDYPDGEPDWADVRPPGGAGFHLACQQIEGYRAPEWPDGPIPQQAHLDFYVDSITDAGARALAAGATRHPHQPGGPDSFVVYLDPAGHPFCLCRA